MTKIQDIPSSDISKLIYYDYESVPLSQLVQRDSILMDLNPGSKLDVLRQLIRPLKKERIIDEGEAFLEKLMQRERLVSTVVVNGVALPYLRTQEKIL